MRASKRGLKIQMNHKHNRGTCSKRNCRYYKDRVCPGDFFKCIIN